MAFSSFWELGEFPANIQNPWRFGSKMAPFDQEVKTKTKSSQTAPDEITRLLPFKLQYYFIINLAVGGTNGFFPDQAVNEGGAPKPWSSNSGNVNLSFRADPVSRLHLKHFIGRR